MSQRNSPWPRPHDPEHLFTKALLAHGPMPPDGWSLTRGVNGKVIYVVARGKPARVFMKDVTSMFATEVRSRYAIKKWSANHCYKVGQSWKNEFLLWIWEQIDEC